MANAFVRSAAWICAKAPTSTLNLGVGNAYILQLHCLKKRPRRHFLMTTRPRIKAVSPRAPGLKGDSFLRFNAESATPPFFYNVYAWVTGTMNKSINMDINISCTKARFGSFAMRSLDNGVDVEPKDKHFYRGHLTLSKSHGEGI